jgi:hypothetical protein
MLGPFRAVEIQASRESDVWDLFRSLGKGAGSFRLMRGMCIVGS